MLSTKDVQSTSGSSYKKTLSPGNHLVNIYDVELQNGYNPGSMQIILRVEGPSLGPQFDGFLKDKNNPGGPKFAGQVGRVRVSPYAFEDKTFADGSKVTRDQSMLVALDRLAMSAGVQSQVKDINASDWQDMINQAKRFLIGKSINVCIGAKEYTNKQGYKEFDLFLPRPKDGKYSHVGSDTSNLMEYDANTHILKEKAAATVDHFEPAIGGDDDFNL
jgi:hypothetical protein